MSAQTPAPTPSQTPSQTLSLAQQFAAPLLRGQVLDTGEDMFAHAAATAQILAAMGADEDTQAASYLTYACEHLSKPQETIEKAFGPTSAQLALHTHQLIKLQRTALLDVRIRTITRDKARDKTGDKAADKNNADSDEWRKTQTETDSDEWRKTQTENVRKMLLAFSRDLRVVVLRLASRLQTLRYFAAAKEQSSEVLTPVAEESLAVFAPLANRLGLGFIKWEIEDLAFRFLEPDVYKDIARKLEAKRSAREAAVASLVQSLSEGLKAQGLDALVQGRPKHIYSIVKKMRGKNLAFHEVMDISALRIITPDSADCYSVLAWLHEHYPPIDGEFDDYIARPKANGYQSLHTVVRDAQGRPTEIQIRSRAMHAHAESGVAAHWAYKEAGKAGYAGASASSAYDQKIALLRQLLAWEREISASHASQVGAGAIFEDRIYVLTPEATVVELAQGATPIDFAYAVHTTLGHRCRGAKVDGALVPLSTKLQNGQTVEIAAAKEGGPSRDWLNPELGFLASHRARAKVRAWFNAEQMQRTVSKGREAVEKLLQREGKTSTNLEALAGSLGFKNASQLFEKVGKEELSLKTIEHTLRPSVALQEGAAKAEEALTDLLQQSESGKHKTPKATTAQPSANHAVRVEGVDTLLTQLAKCCKPMPPDPIAGYVTRGRGISIHRQDCPDYQRLAALAQEHKQEQNLGRLLRVDWLRPHDSAASPHAERSQARYPVDIRAHARDRQGLLRDISELFAKEKVSLTRAQTQSLKNGHVQMYFTAEVAHLVQLQTLLHHIQRVTGVEDAQRV